MKHHSPNFLNNLEEIEKAPHINMWTGVKWTAIFIATLFALFSMTSCTKEVSTTDNPLSIPQNRPVPITVTVKFYKTSHPYVTGDTYGLLITTSKVMTSKTTFHFTWRDGNNTYALQPFIYGNDSAMNWQTMLLWVNGATDMKLLNVEGGEKNSFYTLNVVR